MAESKQKERLSAEDLFNIKGNVAIVTGSSRGVGYKVAKMLAANGANVALCARDGDAVESAAESIRKEYRVKTFAMGIDITEVDKTGSGAEKFVQAAYRNFGRVDILINNAAISGTSLIANPELIEEYKKYPGKIIWKNWLATNAATKEAVKYMKINKYGRIVNMGSIYGGSIDPEKPAGLKPLNTRQLWEYKMSKKIQVTQTKWDANLYAKDGITVNGILATFIQMDKPIQNSSEFTEYFMDKQLIKEILLPQNLLPTILSLVSPLSNTITGTLIPIDGGTLVNGFLRKSDGPTREMSRYVLPTVADKIRWYAEAFFLGKHTRADLDL